MQRCRWYSYAKTSIGWILSHKTRTDLLCFIFYGSWNSFWLIVKFYTEYGSTDLLYAECQNYLKTGESLCANESSWNFSLRWESEGYLLLKQPMQFCTKPTVCSEQQNTIDCALWYRHIENETLKILSNQTLRFTNNIQKLCYAASKHTRDPLHHKQSVGIRPKTAIVQTLKSCNEHGNHVPVLFASFYEDSLTENHVKNKRNFERCCFWCILEGKYLLLRSPFLYNLIVFA